MSGSCCGGKGVSIWRDSSKQWECSDCGSAKSNDPNYLYGGPPRGSDWVPPKYNSTPKCECGGATAKTTHAFWCPVKN